MSRIRAWGWLLALALPLLLFYSWTRLGAETGRVNIERFGKIGSSSTYGYTQLLVEFFNENQRLAVLGDVQAPPVAPQSGIKQMSLQPDGTLRVEIDAKIDSKPVVLYFVPAISSNAGRVGVYYDCVSDTSPAHVRKFCLPSSMNSVADIPAQLLANAQVLKTTSQASGGLGVPISRGAAMGSTITVPANAGSLIECGFVCAKPLSCANARPLICIKRFDDGSSLQRELHATPKEYRGTDIATAQDAKKICQDAFGADFLHSDDGDIRGATVKLERGLEYWIHHPSLPEKNCWR